MDPGEERIWLRLDEVEKKIAAEKLKLDAALEARDTDIIRVREKEKDRLVDERSKLLSALQSQQAGAAGAAQNVQTQLASFNQRLQEAQRERASERARDMEEIERKFKRSRQSVTNKSAAGQQERQEADEKQLVEELVPLNEDLLKKVVEQSKPAFDAAVKAHNAGSLKEQHVQVVYVAVLHALSAEHSNGSLQIHDTHATGFMGLHLSKPDVVVTDCWLPTAAHGVVYVELKKLMTDSAENDVAYQIEEKRQLLVEQQPDRSTFWAVSGGFDSLRLWKMNRQGTKQVTAPLVLSNDRGSAALQALVRLWCMPAWKLGYKAPSLPEPIQLSDDRQLTHLATITKSSSIEEGMPSNDVTVVLAGRLDGALAVAKTTSNEERAQREAAALVALTGVQGLVRLVGTGSTVDGRQWMILQPFGYLMPVDASAACKLHALTQLVASIEHLKTAKYLHGDISHYNVMFTSASGTGDLFLVDLGTTRKLTEADSEGRLVGAPSHTGTPLFMAISTLMGHMQTVSSDLESALYVFLYWATKGGLHWKAALLDSVDAVDRKWSAMTLGFEKLLEKIEDDKEGTLKKAARSLQKLFFGDVSNGSGQYNTKVTPAKFLAAFSA